MSGSPWIEKARRDLRMAEIALENGLPDMAVFHAQQAAEKALKAYLATKGITPPRTHNLRRLIDEAAKLDPEFRLLLEMEVDLLYPLGIELRYPGVDIPPEEEAEEAIEKARKTVEFVERKLLAQQ